MTTIHIDMDIDSDMAASLNGSLKGDIDRGIDIDMEIDSDMAVSMNWGSLADSPAQDACHQVLCGVLVPCRLNPIRDLEPQ